MLILWIDASALTYSRHVWGQRIGSLAMLLKKMLFAEMVSYSDSPYHVGLERRCYYCNTVFTWLDCSFHFFDWHAWNRLISPSKALPLDLLDQQVCPRSVDTLSNAIVFSFVSGQVSSHLKGTPSSLQLCAWTGFITFKIKGDPKQSSTLCLDRFHHI